MNSVKDRFFLPLRREVVHLEGIGEVTLQELSGKQRDDYDRSLYRVVNGKQTLTLAGATARLVALSLIDADTGERIFDDSEIDILTHRVGSSTLARLSRVAQRLSGITLEEQEDEEKN